MLFNFPSKYKLKRRKQTIFIINRKKNNGQIINFFFQMFLLYVHLQNKKKKRVQNVMKHGDMTEKKTKFDGKGVNSNFSFYYLVWQ